MIAKVNRCMLCCVAYLWSSTLSTDDMLECRDGEEGLCDEGGGERKLCVMVGTGREEGEGRLPRGEVRLVQSGTNECTSLFLALSSEKLMLNNEEGEAEEAWNYA